MRLFGCRRKRRTPPASLTKTLGINAARRASIILGWNEETLRSNGRAAQSGVDHSGILGTNEARPPGTWPLETYPPYVLPAHCSVKGGGSYGVDSG